jgi:hypothetical protein
VRRAIAYVASKRIIDRDDETPIDIRTIARDAEVPGPVGVHLMVLLAEQLGPEVSTLLFRRELNLQTAGGTLHSEQIRELVEFLLAQAKPDGTTSDAWWEPFRPGGLYGLVNVDDPDDDRVRPEERRALMQLVLVQPEPADLMRACWAAARIVRRMGNPTFAGRGSVDRRRAYDLLVHLARHALPSATEPPDIRPWLDAQFAGRTPQAVDKARRRMFQAMRELAAPYVD